MIERIEVTAGPGTVIRYGGIVAWADPSASPALISFLAQSARNLGPSPGVGARSPTTSRTSSPTTIPSPTWPSRWSDRATTDGPRSCTDPARRGTAPDGWRRRRARGGCRPSSRPDRPSRSARPGRRPPQWRPTPCGTSRRAWYPARASCWCRAPTAGPLLRLSAPSPPPSPSRSRSREPDPDRGRARARPQPESDQAEAPIRPSLSSSPSRPPHRGTPAWKRRRQLRQRWPPPGSPPPAPYRRSPPARMRKEVEAEPEPEPAPPRPVVPGPAGSPRPADRDRRRQPAPASWGRSRPASPRSPGGGGHPLRTRPPQPDPASSPAPAAASPYPQEPASRSVGTRPPLGALVADDGTIYRLDRSYLVGSNSERDPTVGGGLARPLTLAGSDVSGSHAELRLTDWDVTESSIGALPLAPASSNLVPASGPA